MFKYLTIEDGRVDIFDERWYIKNGRRYASNTFVLNTEIPKELYDYAVEHGTNVHYVLEDKGEIGTIMHHYFETLLREGKVRFEDYPPGSKDLRAFKAWKRMPVFVDFYEKELKHHEILGLEETVFNEDIMVAGTMDAKTSFLGDIHVWDWKSSNYIYDHHKMQVAQYCVAAGADVGHIVAFPQYSKSKQGYHHATLDKGQIERYYEEFLRVKRDFDRLHKMPAFQKYPIEISLKQENNTSLFK